MGRLSELKKVLQSESDKKQARLLQRFFKTGKGEYGEGDIFLGIKVPVQRKISKQFNGLSLDEIQQLLDSKVHEHRMVGLFILIENYKKSDDKKKIFDFYLSNTSNINNWDLVDLSAPNIVGDYLLDKDRSVLYKLARSDLLWEKRISILATFAFIRENDFKDNLKIANVLLNDKHDLIHKAVGWMLREVGKRDQEVEEKFLKDHYKSMPRTMLRYAIEKFSEEKRQDYLKGKV
ncbi:MAG: DNA alkylation repair protein [Nanoarchaeota archaeon]|nr:DNA alkylation repair protein [Nanoarchaeota archaeon]MBU1704892.1 DNA alkylation repair protein [Nanoarchaeota archaeon]